MDSVNREAIPGARRPFHHMALLVLAVLGIWLLLGSFLGIQVYLNGPATGRELSLASAVGMCVRRYLIYAFLTFPVLTLCRRFPFTSERWIVPLAVHGVGAVAFTVLYTAIRLITGSVVNAETLERVPSSLATARDLIRSSLFEQFWMYTSIVTAALAVQYYRQFRLRELRETELKRQMAEHELQVLKLQLHPHFLFNTLNGISTLMARDVKTAQEMLVRLSELLRVALSHSADNEVSLRDELEFVKAYLELEQMRFGERLKVQLDIDAATLVARVPNMLIQPLVENAIQYGIAEIRSGGNLELTTDFKDGKLRIQIVNDGPLHAVPSNPVRGSGIGLGNTRLRLWQLYGDAYRLHMMKRPGGGMALQLEIPFRASGSAEAGAG